MQRGRGGLARRWLAGVALGVLALQAPAQDDSPAPPGPPRPVIRRIEPDLVQVAPGVQAIRLVHAGVDVFVDGSLAHTVVDLTLVNPNQRVLEGELQFPLHPGQTVTGFALDMADGSMCAAVPVPKARGREVFEAVVRRGVDPALLEQTAGDNLRLRVYPLRPGAARHVRIALTEWLPAGDRERLRLPLDFGGTHADQLDLHVRLRATAPGGVRLGNGLKDARVAPSGADTDLTLHADDFAGGDSDWRGLDVAWPASHGDTVLRQRVDGQAFFHAELQVPDQPAPRARPEELTIVWDASGSGARRDHDAELRLLTAFFAWQPDVKVRLRVVRDAVEPDRSFDVRRGDWQALRETLRNIAYDGASNASLWAPPVTRTPAASLALLFSDGLGNWGDPAPVAAGNMPAYAVQSGAGGAAVFLRQWAEARGGRLLDLSTSSTEDALRAIQQRGTRLVRIEGGGFDQAAVASWRPDAGRLVVAGRFSAETARLDLVLEGGDGATLHKHVEIAAPARDDAADDAFVAQRWARLRVDELLAQPELHRTEITALGTRWGIVTPETSLIVLETLQDYQRYEIQPPRGPLRDAYDAAARTTAAIRSAQAARHLEGLVERYRQVQAWWDKDFPKDKPAPQVIAQIAPAPPVDAPRADQVQRVELTASSIARDRAPAMAQPAAPMPPGPLERNVVSTAAADARASRAEPREMAKKAADAAPAASIHIAVPAWTPDAAGMRRLADASADKRYAVYLDQRLEAAGSPAFYLDAAQVFAAHGQRALALRVLSNLAELQLEDRGLLRVLGYRLQEMGETAQAVRVLRRVAELAPDEPQSWRDLGLALAASGAWQAAVDKLWTAASGPWDPRFGDIDVIALGELDAIAAVHPVDLSAVDTRLRRNLPLDVRVALAWDTDNTDIDLWVKDPNGEWVSYQKPLSRQGGRNTRDVTNGYGPEVFSLKQAIPGVYDVRAKYYGSHRQMLGNGTSVMMRLTTGFGRKDEKHRDVILRLEEARDEVLVGSFEVK